MKFRKRLEWTLQQVQAFQAPQIELEQYATSAELATELVQHAAADGVIADCCVVDLGCGTGMLSIACSSLDARYVIGIDCDADALRTCRENIKRIRDDNNCLNDSIACIDVVQGRVLHHKILRAVDCGQTFGNSVFVE